MKQSILSFLLLLLNAAGYSQCCDSVMTQICLDNEGYKWRAEYYYQNSRLEKVVNYNWYDQQYLPTNMTTYTYDTDSNLTEVFTVRFDNSGSNFIPDTTRLSYTFISAHLVTSYHREHFSSGNWIPEQISLYTYDTSSLLTITEGLAFTNGILSSASRLIYSYDSQMNDTLRVWQSSDDTVDWSNYKMVERSFVGNSIDSEAVWLWNDDSLNWIFSDYTKHYYDQLNQDTGTVNGYYSSYWAEWRVRYITSNDYDPSGNQTAYDQYYIFYQELEHENWWYASYDSAGHMTHWEASCFGCGFQLTDSIFNSQNHLDSTYDYHYTHNGTGSDWGCNYYFYSLAGDSALCNGDTTILTAPPGFVSYLWNTGESTQSILTDTSGTYYCLLTTSNGDVFQSAPYIVYMLQPPSISGPDSSFGVCSNGNAFLTAPHFTQTNYQWFRNDTAINSASPYDETLLMDYQEVIPGDYYVIASNDCGQDTSGTTTISLINPPVVEITTSGAIEFCSGDSVVLYSNLSGNNYWYNSSVSGHLDSFIVTTNGTYYLQAFDTNTHCSNRDTIVVTVFNNPQLNIDSVVQPTCDTCADAMVMLSSSSFGITAYSIIPAAGNQNGNIFTDLPPGTYQFCVSDSNGCNTCIDTVISFNTSIVEQGLAGFTLYPNPSRGILYCEFDLQQKVPVNYAILDCYGKEVRAGKLNPGNSMIDLSQLEAGIYFFTLSVQGNVFTKRICILK